MNSFSVLLVDDEIDYVETLVKRMKKRHVGVSGVRSGEEALDFMEKNPIDVVVLDVRMPGMGGIETLRAIKQQFPIVEVIMLTGHASLEVAREGMELGAFDYLIKPINIDELLFKLQDANEKKMIQEKKIQGLKEVFDSSEGR
ncbi:MAG: two-component system response regulator [Deltaproteobacteria bacterium RBG_13_49_15]|nr:MAG: two-component system response regulator [Deltaproteobacteria bacterium RBG_13_49_15]